MSPYKKIGIYTLVGLVSFWFWVLAKAWVTGPSIFSVISLWVGPMIALIVLASIVSLAFAILWQQEFRVRWAIGWIIGILYFIVFGFSFLNIIAGAVLTVSMIYAIKITEIEIRDRTKLHIMLALRRGIPAIIIPLLLAVSFGYYQTGKVEKQLEERNVHFSFRESVSNTVNFFLDGDIVSSGQTVAGEVKQQAIDKALNQLTELFYSYTDKYDRYLPPVLSFGLFLILWGLSFIFVYISLGLSKLIYMLLKSTEFVKVEEIDVKAERLIV